MSRPTMQPPLPGLAPTHYCAACGAIWRQCDDRSWNLRSVRAGACCDAAPMGEQIVPLGAMAQPEAQPVAWGDEADDPPAPGWYAIQRADRSLCLRAFGDGLWWIPLRGGWMSGLPAGFRWCGPLEPLDWETPQPARAPLDSASAVDWLGRALDLEAQAKRVESQTVERAMLAGAHALRLMGAALAQRGVLMAVLDEAETARQPLPHNGSDAVLDMAETARAPLTDEQVIKAWRDAQGTRHGYVEFARAIERAHGIGGEPAAPASPWVSVAERLPQDGQAVAFVVDARDAMRREYHGRVLGGRYSAVAGFTAPGMSFRVSHWTPLPAAPAQDGGEQR